LQFINTMKELLFYSFLIIYTIFSIIESLEFYREDKFFSKKIKLIHLILIWIIPFLYAMLLSQLRKKIKGSFDPDKKLKNLGAKGKTEHCSVSGANNNFNH
jgi:hypothetical protein